MDSEANEYAARPSSQEESPHLHKRDRSIQVIPICGFDELPQHVTPSVQIVHAKTDSVPAFTLVVFERFEAALLQPGLHFRRLLQANGQH